MADLFEAVGFLKGIGEAEIGRLAKSSRNTIHASLRFEVVFRRAAAAENGAPRASSEHESAALGLSVMVAKRGSAMSYGYCGTEVGRAALNRNKLVDAVRTGFKAAYDRARLGARI